MTRGELLGRIRSSVRGEYKIEEEDEGRRLALVITRHPRTRECRAPESLEEVISIVRGVHADVPGMFKTYLSLAYGVDTSGGEHVNMRLDITTFETSR